MLDRRNHDALALKDEHEHATHECALAALIPKERALLKPLIEGHNLILDEEIVMDPGMMRGPQIMAFRGQVTAASVTHEEAARK